MSQNVPVPDFSADDDDDAESSIGHRMRLRRKLRNLSLREVAGQSGLSIGQLSQIERGLSAPSLRSIRAICAALDMPVGWLFDDAGAALGPGADIVVRAAGRRTLDLGAKGMVKALLTPDSCPGIQMMEIVIRPGGSSGERPYNQVNGAKCGLVTEGALGLALDDAEYRLEEGDSFAFDATRWHRFWCDGDTACRVIWVTAPAFY